MILIPESVVEVERQERRAKYKAEFTERLRAVVRKVLVELDDELGQFEQTTHGRIVLANGIEGFAGDLVACWKNPSSHSVSNLSQAIGYFLKESA